MSKSVLGFVLLLCSVAVACGDDDGGGSEPSCDDVCSAITSVCGLTPPGCTVNCGGLSATTKRCVVAASSCIQIDACASTEPPADTGRDEDVGQRDEDGGHDGGQDGGRDAGAPAACEIGEVADCPAPSLTCTSILFTDVDREWCSPICNTSSDCDGYVCNSSSMGTCVPGCTSGSPDCPAPFTRCEVAFGATEGYCR